MSIYGFTLKSPRKGVRRVLRYSTVGAWACPEIIALSGKSIQERVCAEQKHDVAYTGKWRKEPIENTQEEHEDSDGSIVATLHLVTRRWKITKSGRVPTCKCGQPMVWRGWAVWLRDEAEDAATTDLGIGIFRDGTRDTELWHKYARTQKERERMVQAALKNNR